MNDDKTKEIPLSSKADAAFLQAARKVIQQARQTNTPVIIWEENRIKEINKEIAQYRKEVVKFSKEISKKIMNSREGE